MNLFAFFFVLVLAACSDQENNPIKSGKAQSQSETAANQEEVCFDHNDINSIIDILSNPSNTGGSDSNPTASCLTSDDSDVRAKQARIAEKLFGLELCEADSLTNYDYNNYMADPHNDTDKCDGYLGGHSGWDVQTKSVALDSTADEPFYSLTSGEVIAIDSDRLGKIAVYNAIDGKTTLYLHAREIYVSQGQTVNVGTALGIQGNAGLDPSDPNKNEHVHIEVRDGLSEYPSCGAGATTAPINIDPIEYLYEAMQVQ